MAIVRENFLEAADKAVTGELRRGWWLAWPEYEPRERGGVRYIEAVGPDRIDADDLYRPLVDFGGLFLEFARLADGERLSHEPEAVVLKWAHARGTLGLATVKHDGRLGTSTRGGVEDSVEAFVAEARAANSVLHYYQAATNPEGVDVDTIRSHFARTGLRKYLNLLTDTPHSARRAALQRGMDTIVNRVAGSCYPTIYEQPDSTYKEGYDFTNLLGAMWLQMLWLWTAGPNNVCRCEYPDCNAVISYEQPIEGKKPRSDKKFCGDGCRVANHRLKARIEAARH